MIQPSPSPSPYPDRTRDSRISGHRSCKRVAGQPGTRRYWTAGSPPRLQTLPASVRSSRARALVFWTERVGREHAPVLNARSRLAARLGVSGLRPVATFDKYPALHPAWRAASRRET